MPFFRGFTHEGMPEKSEFMSSIIFCKMHPGIWKDLCNMTFMKCPFVPSYDGTPLPQISLNCRLNPCFFFEFSDCSQVGWLSWFNAAFDQLQAC
ncbi:hypothetical protein AXX04_23645 [Pseudomonas aeruginosa]|nr:hypothetical protein AXX04_23645 [Pseudomonas aeruginosa]